MGPAVIPPPVPPPCDFFPLRDLSPIQIILPNQILSTPTIGSQKGSYGVTPTFFSFRLDVPNLQILQIGNLQGMSTDSTMSFNNDDSFLVHCLSRDQQHLSRGENVLIRATSLRV